MKGTYNFTDGFNKNVQDKAPDWMNDLFNNDIKKQEVVEIKDLYSQNSLKNNKKCSMCGKILANNEINICNTCIKLKNNKYNYNK